MYVRTEKRCAREPENNLLLLLSLLGGRHLYIYYYYVVFCTVGTLLLYYILAHLVIYVTYYNVEVDVLRSVAAAVYNIIICLRTGQCGYMSNAQRFRREIRNGILKFHCIVLYALRIIGWPLAFWIYLVARVCFFSS